LVEVPRQPIGGPLKVTMLMRGEQALSGSRSKLETKDVIHCDIVAWKGIMDAELSTTST
jgi:hypothetical protein